MNSNSLDNEDEDHYQTITINDRQFRIRIFSLPPTSVSQQQQKQTEPNSVSPLRSPSTYAQQQASIPFVVGQLADKPGVISQGATTGELLSNMADAIQLIENQIGRGPKGFWIKKTIKDVEGANPEDSWQGCVKMLESAGYRLVLETDRHKKFRSPTTGRGVSTPNFTGGNIGGGGLQGAAAGPTLSLVSFIIVPVQKQLDRRIVEFYKNLVRG